MYQNIYRWVSGNFYPFSAGILLTLFALEILGKHRSACKGARTFWKSVFMCYLLGVLFLTLGSRIRTEGHEPNLKIHWKDMFLADWGRGRIPWEDFANVILFLPFGIFSRELCKKGAVFCILSGAGLSICIEGLQLLTGCGYCDINDFLCNVLGTAGGYCWSCMALWAQERFRIFWKSDADL